MKKELKFRKPTAADFLASKLRQFGRKDCQHDMTIFDSYEVYAVCKKCSWHDWDMPGKESMATLDYFKQKYPGATIHKLDEDTL